MEGQTLAGRYTILAHLGDGAVATVWRARDGQLGTEVAIKLMHAHLARDPLARERLKREVLAARKVSGDGVLAVHDLVVDGDRLFVVEDLAPGGDLAQRLEAEGPLPLERVMPWMSAVARALAHAHAAGVLHRDVKSANILLGADGRARLGDFGLARVEEGTRATATSQLAGSLGYTAPEVLSGVLDDPRSDQYALAVTTFELLTGLRPFGDTSPADSLRRQLGEDAPRADVDGRVPKPVADVLARALSRRAEDRFPTMDAFAHALDAAMGGTSPEAAPPLKACEGCGEPVVPGLINCPHCGRARVQAPRSAAGPYAVHVYAPFRQKAMNRNGYDRWTFDEKRRIVDTVTAATGDGLRPPDEADGALARGIVKAADGLDRAGADLIVEKLRAQGLNASPIGPDAHGLVWREWFLTALPLFPLVVIGFQMFAILAATLSSPNPGTAVFALLPLLVGVFVAAMIRRFTQPVPLLVAAGANRSGIAEELPFPDDVRDAVTAISDVEARDRAAEVLRAASGLRGAAADLAPTVKVDVDEAALATARAAVQLAKRLGALNEARPSPRARLAASAAAAESERAGAVVELRHQLLDMAAGLRSASTALHRGAAKEASVDANEALARLRRIRDAVAPGLATEPRASESTAPRPTGAVRVAG